MFHLKGNAIPGTESTLAEGKEKLRSGISWEGKAALCYIKRDAKQLLNETAHVIAENYSAIGKPFDTPEVTAMVESIKKMLSNHYGIKHYEEYQLILEQISFPLYTEKEDYLGYVMNALKYH